MKLRLRFSLAIGALAVSTFSFAPLAFGAGPVPATVLGGATRYQCAIASSRATFATGAATNAVFVGGGAWSDALGASALAGVLHAPVLLCPPGHATPALSREISRLGVRHAWIVGGAGSLSPAAAAGIAASLPSTGTIQRIGGANRYEVARAVATRVKQLTGSSPSRAFVASGLTYSDAMVASVAAYKFGWPILLSDLNHRSRAAADVSALDIPDVTVVGRSVTAPTVQALRSAVGAAHVTWLSGSDRYATALTLADFMVDNWGFDRANPVLVSGIVPFDALAGAAYAATRNSPVLLTSAAGEPQHVGDYLFAHRAEVSSYGFLGGTSVMPSGARIEAQQSLRSRMSSRFLIDLYDHELCSHGVRVEGSASELRAARFISKILGENGYSVTTQTVPLPGGKVSHNIIAEKSGDSTAVVVLGAHMDAKYPSPGGNDNGSGCAVLLDTARVLSGAEGLHNTVRFCFFGAEEIYGSNPSQHHFGSRRYVASLGAAERAKIVAMVSVDEVGYGSTFNIRSMGVAPMTTVNSLKQWSNSSMNQRMSYLADTGSSGQSDHEAFEKAGIPSAWLEWRYDPWTHTSGDDYWHVRWPDRMARTARVLRTWLLATTP